MSRDESAARGELRTPRDEEDELTYDMAATAARAAIGMFAEDVLIMDMRQAVSYTDYFVVPSAETERKYKMVHMEEALSAVGPLHSHVPLSSVWVA